MSERGGGRGMVGRGRRRDDDDDTSGHPGIGDPAREVSLSAGSRGAHRFPQGQDAHVARGGPRARGARAARAPPGLADGRATEDDEDEDESGVFPSRRVGRSEICLVTTRSPEIAPRRFIASRAPRHARTSRLMAPPLRPRARARAVLAAVLALLALVPSRVRAVSRRFERAPPPGASCDRRVRRVRGERGGPPRRARVRGGQAPREARREGPPRGRRRRQARGRARGRRRVRSPRALATVRTQDHRRRRRVVVVVYPPPTTTPPPPPPPPPPR